MNTVKHERSLFMHRRDLRVDDNTALREAAHRSAAVASCFVVDPRQVYDNVYRGDASVQFMHKSLLDLDAQYRELGSRLHVLRGIAHEAISQILRGERIDAVFINRDYTPFSVARDKAVEEACEEAGVALYAYDDTLLHAPGVVMKKDGSPYTVFTPYHANASAQPLREPARFEGRMDVLESAGGTESLADWLGLKTTRKLAVRGGRKHALEILGGIAALEAYQSTRDFPARSTTTHLSAHLKFGCCSAREAARAIRDHLGDGHDLLRQLHWRDFFTQVAYFHPRVFGGAFHEQYDAIEWENDEELFAAWCDGQTGYPIVDAGMRELEQTGYMHNRVRMIVASFLTKDLHVDWRWGERHFATRLVDYDPAVNNGNWQWAASTGCDAQPYFRIFNPWLQQKKFDPEAIYIKRWVTELESLEPTEIHNLWKKPGEGLDYPAPVVDHAERAHAAKAIYQAARRRP